VILQMDKYRLHKAFQYGYHFERIDGVEMFVPVTKRICDVCDGDGFEPDDCDEPEDCIECDGSGEIVDSDYDNALNLEEFDTLCHRRELLEKRYGTWKVKSIADYFVKG
jgi:hypothetical protein